MGGEGRQSGQQLCMCTWAHVLGAGVGHSGLIALAQCICSGGGWSCFRNPISLLARWCSQGLDLLRRNLSMKT